MMGSKGDGSGGNNGVPAVIPTGARKIVLSLKEIVSCSDLEIYAALKECDMDPYEAVNRILSQDPFHSVKSKREKKKEVKDTTDPRPRGGRTVVDCYASRGRANAPFSTDTMKATPKRENGSHAFLSSSSSKSAISAPNINQKLAHSDHLPLENKAPAIGENDLITSSIKLSSGFPRAWGGTSGQVSMAEIVKMGKPQVMSSVTPNHSSRLSMAPGLHGDLELHDQSTNLYKREPPSISEHVPSNDDDWPFDEQQAPPPNNDGWPPFENSLDGSGHQHMTSQLDGGHLLEDGHIESNTNHVGFTSVSSRNIPEDNGRDPSLYDDSVYKNANVNVFQPHMHSYKPNEDDYAEDDGVAAVSLEHLSLQKNERGSAPEEDGPAVVIPDHLQVHPSDCQHLSFGSFAPNIGTFSGLTGSRSFKSSLSEAQPIADTSSASHPDMRDSEHYSDEHLRPPSNGDDVHSSLSNDGNYEAPSASQPEMSKQHPGESIVENHYEFPSAASGYSYENSQALDSTFAHPQASSPMQNLSPFSNVQPSYTDPLPSSLLASALQTGKETDLSYLPFPVAQPMATKYNNTASSLNSSIMSTQEGFRAGSNSAAQQAPQNLPNAGLTTGPGLPQHLAMPAYSQPGLSLGHFASMANMVSYPFLPQSYSYMPSAFQQVFASNNTYHQSLAAAALPQYKSSLSTSNLPQSGAVASGYGLNGSSNVPGGNFMLNPPSANATMGYEDTLNSHYNDANNLLSLQQNDNSGMWLPGTAARTVPNLPASTYYDFQSQSQQPGGLRLAQQLPQHFSDLGYPNFYQSSGITMEQQQQQQVMRDGALGGSQGQQQPKQSPQLWHNTY